MKPQMTAVQLVRDNKAGHCRSGSTGEAGKCPFFKKHEGFLIAWMEVLGKTEPQAMWLKMRLMRQTGDRLSRAFV